MVARDAQARLLKTGPQLKAARALAQISQRDLAELACLHRNSIRYLERQERITTGYSADLVVEALRTRGVEIFAEPSPGVRLIADG